MNITRRGFLKLLASIPAVAALPVTAQVLALPEVIEPIVVEPAPALSPRGSWLRINGVPVDCRSLSIVGRQEYIETVRFAALPEYGPGLRHHELSAEVLVDPDRYCVIHDAFLASDDALIEAEIHNAYRLHARGRFTRVGLEAHPDLFVAKMDVVLLDAEWKSK